MTRFSQARLVTNQLLFVNTLAFLALSWAKRSLLSPSSKYLLMFGAKEPVSIGLGEWWRFATPMFLHVGVIHFALNMLGLRYIGRYLESILGSAAFAAIYLLTGVAGNVASLVASVGMGAGASGALFGLIGTGISMEGLVGWRNWQHRGERAGGITRAPLPRLGPFTRMAAINLGIAAALNLGLRATDAASGGFDNAAHIGGLGAGLILGLALFSWRPNAVLPQRRLLALGIVALFLGGLAGSGYLATRPETLALRFLEAGELEHDPGSSYFYFSRGLILQPQSPELRLARARILLKHHELEAGLADLKGPPVLGHESLLLLAHELALQGHAREANAVTKLAESI